MKWRAAVFYDGDNIKGREYRYVRAEIHQLFNVIEETAYVCQTGAIGGFIDCGVSVKKVQQGKDSADREILQDVIRLSLNLKLNINTIVIVSNDESLRNQKEVENLEVVVVSLDKPGNIIFKKASSIPNTPLAAVPNKRDRGNSAHAGRGKSQVGERGNATSGILRRENAGNQQKETQAAISKSAPPKPQAAIAPEQTVHLRPVCVKTATVEKIAARRHALEECHALNAIMNSILPEGILKNIETTVKSKKEFRKKGIDFYHMVNDCVVTAQNVAAWKKDQSKLSFFADTGKLDKFRASLDGEFGLTEESLSKALRSALAFREKALEYCKAEDVVAAIMSHEGVIRDIQAEVGAVAIDHRDEVALDRYWQLVAAYRKAVAKGISFKWDPFTTRKIFDLVHRYSKKAA